MLAARVGWDGEEQTRGQEEVSVSLGNRKSLFSCSWGWEEDFSSGESSVLPAEDPCTPSVALVTSILCLRGNFTSSQGLRELCQTHSLLLCELAHVPAIAAVLSPLVLPVAAEGGCILWCEAELWLGGVSRPGITAVLCSCRLQRLGSRFLCARFPC